jgi:hypothetical protein
MGWSIGYDSQWERDIGYGVPALCDQPNCEAEIHRGLSYVCGGDAYGGDRGCGLFFCSKHLCAPLSDRLPYLCDRCYPRLRKPHEAKPDLLKWSKWKLKDSSWGPWRKENPDKVAALKKLFEVTK